MSIDKVIERNQAVGLLAWQCMLRASGLMSLGAISSARKALDTYLLCLQHGAVYAEQARLTDPPEKLVVVYVDALSDCVEKSWQDFRNSLQILLLTQDEVLIWVARIDRTLAERGRKQ